MEQQTEEQVKEVSLTETLAEVKDESGQKLSPKVEAVMFLKGAIPQFQAKLYDDAHITGTQAKHVLSALVESPLEKETPQFMNQEAEDLFALGLMITNAKLILFREGVKEEEFLQAEKLVNDSFVSEETNNQGENNG